MSIPLTHIEGVPEKSDAKPGMAYYANTGPFGTTCGDCIHKGYWRKRADKINPDTREWESRRPRKVGGCAMFYKLSGQHGPPVEKQWPSCRYFGVKDK